MSAPTFAPLRTVNARDLLARPPRKPPEIVPGILPVGLSLLAAAPKVGKSWLAYQLAVAVASGATFLGRALAASKGDVLYLALEDGEHRAWNRIARVLTREFGDASDMPRLSGALELAFNADRGDALVLQVEEWLSAHPSAKLVIVDTLQKVRARSTGRRNQYELDVEDVGRILGIAQRHPDVAVLVVHHDTKQSRQPGSDFVDAVSGTSGIAGSVDAILLLRRRRHETVGTLDVTGRDVRESLTHLAYDDEDPHWSVDTLGGLSAIQRATYEFLRDNGPNGPTAVGRETGQDKSNASRTLSDLVNLGLVVNRRGKYAVEIDFLFEMDDNHDNDDNRDNQDNDDND